MNLKENIYSSQTHFDQEQKTIFRKNWVCAGFGHQVPKPGDIAPVTVGGMPLMLVRQGDMSLTVFHNVCRHRGAQIFTEACSSNKMIRCPYHSWVYGLDGELRRRPHFDGPDEHVNGGEGLWKVRSDNWCDLVFVDMSGEAEPFEDFIRPLQVIGDGFGVNEAVFDESIEIEIPANWKLLVENFVDGYHVASVHPQLEQSLPTRTHHFRQEGPLFIGQAPRQTFDSEQGGGSYVSGLPNFKGVTQAYQNQIVYMSVFPNLCVNMAPDRLSIYLMQPIGPDLSLEIICNYYAPEAFDATTESMRRQMTQNQLAFNAEDIDILKQLQSGRSSEVYDDGCPSPYWDSNAESFLAMCAENTRSV